MIHILTAEAVQSSHWTFIISACTEGIITLKVLKAVLAVMLGFHMQTDRDAESLKPLGFLGEDCTTSANAVLHLHFSYTHTQCTDGETTT